MYLLGRRLIIYIQKHNFFSSNLKRLRRRHRLLMAISIIFLVCWLPLNVLNLLLDLYNPFTLPRDKEMMHIIYAICHLFGMSSACANPFLYGWFNENFRGEFKLILTAPSRWCAAFSAVRQRPRPSPIQIALNSDVVSTLKQGNRSNQMVRSEYITDIVNTDKNSSFVDQEQTSMFNVNEVRVDIEWNQNEITIDEPISAPSQLREVLVPEGDTTNAILHINFNELPSVIVSILQSPSILETYL